ncbi:hypothetical protein [Streptomyces alboflavus]|uniref:hypothetical protein n=1 Tax=Streptomyces alboflavus TaxID=67267 RepID=UPI0036CD2774
MSWLEGSSLTAGGAGLIALGIVCAGALARVRPPAGDGTDVRLLTVSVGLLVLPTLLLLLASVVKPLYVDRYVLYRNAGLALLVGAALDRAARGTRPRVVAVAVTAAAVVLALLPASAALRTPQSRIDDAAAIARAVREAGASGDGLLYAPLRRRAWTLPYAGGHRRPGRPGSRARPGGVAHALRHRGVRRRPARADAGTDPHRGGGRPE